MMLGFQFKHFSAAALILTLAIAPTGLMASGGGDDSHAPAEKKEEDTGLFGSSDNIVPLPPIIAPVFVQGRLSSHLYIYMAAITDSESEASKVTARMPYIRDAAIKVVHKEYLISLSKEEDPDISDLVARLLAAINHAVGEAVVTELEVGQVDTAPY